METIVFNVFSDGASFNNGYKDPNKPQRCAYGYTICIGNKIVRQRAKDLGDNTISFAELSGALDVLKFCIKILNKDKYKGLNYKINLYSDSRYVVDSINKWIYNWMRNDWCSTSGKVPYKELWEELLYIKEQYNVGIHHIKGHLPKKELNALPEEKKFYHLMNEECDKLAKEVITEFKKTLMNEG